ncbi:nucleotidyltransferase family protein [Candidatus Woesearchaeota archaeon]|nr:nucleotidyltransferase family protein [Candidatus Woesearchaeota archaeon]
MKAIILAGGYAKRLWPVTENMPKQLLPVAGKPIIEYPLENIELTKRIDEVIISINAYFEFNFREWFTKYQFRKKTKLVIEKTYSNEEKLGSIGALDNLIKKLKLKGSLLVIGGDNMFEFPIRQFINYYNKKKTSVVALYNIKDKSKVKGRYGVVEVGEGNKITGFEEKPQNPRTTLVNTACTILSKRDIRLIPQYIEEGNDRDAFGYLLQWLFKKRDLHGFIFDSPWFDIGSFEAYDQANLYYRKKRQGEMRERKVIVSL